MTLQQTIAEYLKYTGQKGLDISAALIDCDGVLYDSMKYHTQAWVKLMKKNGIKCTRDEFYELEGMTGSEIIKMKFKQGAGKNITDDEARALYGVKTRYFTELGEAPVMPGAKRVLETLKDADVERVLVTGSQQDVLLERIEKDFPGLFGEVKVTGHDVRKGKPNRERPPGCAGRSCCRLLHHRRDHGSHPREGLVQGWCRPRLQEYGRTGRRTALAARGAVSRQSVKNI